jgi:hypothetical protein
MDVFFLFFETHLLHLLGLLSSVLNTNGQHSMLASQIEDVTIYIVLFEMIDFIKKWHRLLESAELLKKPIFVEILQTNKYYGL